MAASVYSRALQKAAEVLGGRDKLAQILQVPPAEIERWIGDQGKPPRDIFLRIVDVILDESGPAAGTDDKSEPPARDAAGGRGRYLT
jgi:hypothetical protein